MLTLTDVFGTDIFKTTSLCAAIELLPHKPSRIGEMGLFSDEGVPTTTIVIEERQGVLSLLPTRARGADATIGTGEKRTARSLTVPHIPHDDTILADELLNVREFGSADLKKSVAATVNKRLEKMKQNHEVTLEHLRAGAIQGQVLDADGVTVIYNLFTEFGVSETEVDFLLDSETTNVRGKCIDVIETIENEMGGVPFTKIHCLCGKEWFKLFVDHAKVQAAYTYWRDGEALRSDPRKGFEFAGITFETYRATVGSVDFVNDYVARFFPTGVPELFKTFYAPADFVEAVGTVGIPLYAKAEKMPFDRGVQLHTQSNPLPICMRPASLVAAASEE